MTNIYELQKQGANIQVKPGASTSVPKLNLNTLQQQGAKIEVKEPSLGQKALNFGKEVAGGIYNSAANIGATIEQPIATVGETFGQNLAQKINKLKGTEVKPVPTFSENLKKRQDAQASDFAKFAPKEFKYESSKTPKEFAGAVLETGSNVGLGFGAKKLGTEFLTKKALPYLAAEGATVLGANSLGSQLREGKGVIESLPETAKAAAIGAVAFPAIGAGGILASKAGSKISKTVAKDSLPKQIDPAIKSAQGNLDKVLDNLVIPNNTPNTTFRNQIERIRTQYPNLQEEVAVRSGQPIKTVKEGGKVKFQTANQSVKLIDDAIKQSQEAGAMAKAANIKGTAPELLEEIDKVIVSRPGINVAKIRTDLTKKVDDEFFGLPNGEMNGELMNTNRVNAGQRSNKYDDKGNVGDTDADDIIREAYKNLMAKKIADPEFQTILRNSADNFELGNFLKQLHGKEAYTPRTGLPKAVQATGSTIETIGKMAPFQVGKPVEYIGKFIKAIPEFTSAEQQLISREVEKLVSRATQVGAKFTDSEQRILNFQKRLEQSNKTGDKIPINQEIIDELKNMEAVKKATEKAALIEKKRGQAAKIFNKRFGDEVVIPEETDVDLAKYYDRYQNTNAKERADLTAELYRELLEESRLRSQKSALPKPEPIPLPESTAQPKPALPKSKEPEIDESMFYPTDKEAMLNKSALPVAKERLQEVETKIVQAKLSKEAEKQALEASKEAIEGVSSLEEIASREKLNLGSEDDVKEYLDKLKELQKKVNSSYGIQTLQKEKKILADEIKKMEGYINTGFLPKAGAGLAGAVGTIKSAQALPKALSSEEKEVKANPEDLRKQAKIEDISDYDISKYATNTAHEANIKKIYDGINKKGRDFYTAKGINETIKDNFPNSKITGEMILEATRKHKVDPKLLFAIMLEDSSLGTTGTGSKNNNPGNVAQYDNLKKPTKGYKTLQEGINAVAKWLENHKISNKK